MIKAIFFDFGQTLVDSAKGFKQAEKTAKKWLFADLFPLGEPETYQTFIKIYRGIRKDFHNRSVFSRPAIWTHVYHHFDRAVPQALLEEKESEYWKTVRQNTSPFPETIPVLEKLAGSYRLALITNTQGQKETGKHRIAIFPDIEQYFDRIVVAGESGMAPKPSVDPFNSCLNKMGIAPQEAVYVGDDWRIDIEGSHNAGLHPVWLKHYSVKRNWPQDKTLNGQATPMVITALDQLPGILEKL